MTFYRRNLPHWQPEGKPIFLTWRLFGSLPIRRRIPVHSRPHRTRASSVPTSTNLATLQVAEIHGVGKLQVENAIFGHETNADAIGEADVLDQPVGRGQWFGRQGGSVPEKVGAFVLDFGGSKLEDFSFVDLN